MTKETIIHFFRHGKTQNPQQLIKGQAKGFPLRIDGMIEVKKLADFIKKSIIFAVFHSPTLRGEQTANIIAQELNLNKVKASDLLNEWNIKIWELKPLSEVQKSREWPIYLNKITDLNNYKIGEKPKEVIKTEENTIITVTVYVFYGEWEK